MIGYEVLQSVLDSAIHALLELYENEWKEKDLHPKTKLLLNLLQPPDEKISNKYDLLLIATDFVSGMTDDYAIDLFKKLKRFSKVIV